MRLKHFLPWACSLALTLLAACSIAGTNNPGIIYFPGSVPYDHDATNFIGRAGISPTGSEAKAIGTLIHDLKQANIWTNLYAFYPFVGASSNSCAQNLVGTNFGIAWSGTNHFRQNGVTSDGISGYGNTGFFGTNLLAVLTNNIHLYAFASLHDTKGLILGAIRNAAGSGAGSMIWSDSTQLKATYPNGAVFNTFVSGIRYGHIFTQRTPDTNVVQAFGNITMTQPIGSLIETNSLTAYAPTNTFMVLGNPSPKNNGVDGFGSNTVRAASFGLGLSDQQITNLFTAVNRFQTALHRQGP